MKKYIPYLIRFAIIVCPMIFLFFVVAHTPQYMRLTPDDIGTQWGNISHQIAMSSNKLINVIHNVPSYTSETVKN